MKRIGYFLVLVFFVLSAACSGANESTKKDELRKKDFEGQKELDKHVGKPKSE